MRKLFDFISVVILLAVIGVGYYWWLQGQVASVGGVDETALAGLTNSAETTEIVDNSAEAGLSWRESWSKLWDSLTGSAVDTAVSQVNLASPALTVEKSLSGDTVCSWLKKLSACDYLPEKYQELCNKCE
ncbi:MAG: hypothetical protein WCT37_04345 [Patescibacteria group bacterium]